MPQSATYHQVAVGLDGQNLFEGVPTKSIPTLVAQLGHTGRRIDIFKMDCEGCELEVYEGFVHPNVSIRQIQLEVHSPGTRSSNVREHQLNPLFETLFKAGYVIFNKEPNTLAKGEMA